MANACAPIGSVAPDNDQVARKELTMLTIPDRVQTLEEWAALLVAGAEHEKEGQWYQAEVAYRMIQQYQGAESIFNFIASLEGRSANTIRSWVAAYQAFPNESDRIPTLHFTHHCIAAISEDPSYWIAQAADNHWTTQELRVAIRRSKDGYNPAFERKVMEQQIQRQVEDYNALWGKERQCLVEFKPVVSVAPEAG